MEKQKTIKHTFKKDKYVNARGGNSHFLDIYCSKCNEHILLYQKDGPGRLLRLYLDRIFEPQEFLFLKLNSNNKNKIPNLKCPGCLALIGTPMVYISEKRLAIRLIYGSFVKKKSEGIYPPFYQTKTVQNLEKGGKNEN